ncbi:MAG: hypothetical protein HOY78_42115 [Saccharothrix sp.]|nr:hypothetical protein [Saccharothrix sp.]
MALRKSRFEPDAELIIDREVAQTDEDRLGHEEIAAQLERLVLTVPALSNIALYGAWGSGKSGIANLLKQRLERVRGVKFARFDAFKYAENPLRRNFISATADALNIRKSKYKNDLYTGTTTTGYKIPASGLLKLAALFIGALFACAAVILAIVASISFFQTGDF